LGPGDEAALRVLTLGDFDLDVGDQAEPHEPLDVAAAQRYLTDPSVVHWVAFQGEEILGFLYAHVLPLRYTRVRPRELLFYEIGVRSAHRRRGIGRALVHAMTQFMAVEGLAEVWVLADNPGAVDFYRACGFSSANEQPTYMTRAIEPE